MDVDGVSAVEVAEGREEEVSAAMEVEGAGAEPLGTRAPLGAIGCIARMVSLSFAVGLDGIVAVGLRAVAAATGRRSGGVVEEGGEGMARGEMQQRAAIAGQGAARRSYAEVAQERVGAGRAGPTDQTVVRQLWATLDGMDPDEGEADEGDDVMEEPVEVAAMAEEVQQTEEAVPERRVAQAVLDEEADTTIYVFVRLQGGAPLMSNIEVALALGDYLFYDTEQPLLTSVRAALERVMLTELVELNAHGVQLPCFILRSGVSVCRELMTRREHTPGGVTSGAATLVFFGDESELRAECARDRTFGCNLTGERVKPDYVVAMTGVDAHDQEFGPMNFQAAVKSSYKALNATRLGAARVAQQTGASGVAVEGGGSGRLYIDFQGLLYPRQLPAIEFKVRTRGPDGQVIMTRRELYPGSG